MFYLRISGCKSLSYGKAQMGHKAENDNTSKRILKKKKKKTRSVGSPHSWTKYRKVFLPDALRELTFVYNTRLERNVFIVQRLCALHVL